MGSGVAVFLSRLWSQNQENFHIDVTSSSKETLPNKPFESLTNEASRNRPTTEPTTETMNVTLVRGQNEDSTRLQSKPVHNEAENEADREGTPSETHNFRLSKDGLFAGRLTVFDPKAGKPIPVNNVIVYFLRLGRILVQINPGIDGRFQVKILPGVYSLIVAGDDGFLAMGLNVVSANHGEEGRKHEVSLGQKPVTGRQFDAVLVPPRNVAVLQGLVRENLDVDLEQFMKINTPQRTPKSPGRNIGPGEFMKKPTTGSHVVRLQPGGKLVGRMRRIHPQTGRPIPLRRIDVFFIKNGRLVTQTRVRENGVFEVDGLKPGFHSVVTTAPKGIAAFDVELRQSRDKTAFSVHDNDGLFKTVGETLFVQDVIVSFEIDAWLIDPQDVEHVSNHLLKDVLDGSTGPVTEMGSPLGSGTGGSGGSGGGGFENAMSNDLLKLLLGIGGGIGAAAAVADGNDTAAPAIQKEDPPPPPPPCPPPSSPP